MATSVPRAASGAATGPADAAGDSAYRKAISAGVSEYDAGRFEEARSLFLRAHELAPNARTYRGIGMASFELRDYIAAVRNLSAALQDARKALSPEQRKSAQDLLDRSRTFVDVYTVKLVPSTARLTVDGRPAEFEADGTLLFGFGTHRLEVSAPGMTKRSKMVDVRGGARKDLTITLDTASPNARRGVGEEVATPPPTVPPSPARLRGTSLALLWASAGAAVLAAGAGAYWYAQHSELSSCRTPPLGFHCTNEGPLLAERNTGMGITLGAGVAALSMALVGALTWNRGAPPQKTSSALTCTAGPGSVTCGWRF